MTNRARYLLGVLAAIVVACLASEGQTPRADLIRLAVVVGVVVWLVGLISLLRRRDIEIHDKLSWVVAVLLLNGVGAIVYFVFGPRREPTARSSEEEEDAVPVEPEGMSWNPILGMNRLPRGKGLNLKDADQEDNVEGDD